MDGPLSGIGVLVTRPAHQAHHLCQLIEAQGGSTIVLPALQINPTADRPAIRAAVGPIDRYHLVIFVSANAVRFGGELIAQRRDLRIAAIGRATAQALNAAGYRVSVVPSTGADSESLLASAGLRHMSGQRVLIVRGKGGRELLGDTLREQRVTFNDVQRTAQSGDFVVVNYTGTSEGKPLTEIAPTARGLAEQKNFWIELKPGSFIPGFGEQLVGRSAGEKQTVNITFPKDLVLEWT